MSITVKNRHTYKGVGEYVGRPSPLGNPYSHLPKTIAKYKVRTREESIQRYDVWLRDQYRQFGKVYEELNRLARIYEKEGELRLVCWCSPLPCHADIIKEAIVDIMRGDY